MLVALRQVSIQG